MEFLSKSEKKRPFSEHNEQVMVVIPTKSRAVQLCDTASLSTLSAQKTAQTLLIIFFANLQTKKLRRMVGAVIWWGIFQKRTKRAQTETQNFRLKSKIPKSPNKKIPDLFKFKFSTLAAAAPLSLFHPSQTNSLANIQKSKGRNPKFQLFIFKSSILTAAVPLSLFHPSATNSLANIPKSKGQNPKFQNPKFQLFRFKSSILTAAPPSPCFIHQELILWHISQNPKVKIPNSKIPNSSSLYSNPAY